LWTQVHPRLSRLDNRLDAATRGRIMGELHELVPMVPPDDAVTDKLKRATRNVDLSIALRDMFRGTVASKKVMLAKLQRDIAEGEAQVAKMDDAVKHDEDKLRRLEAGEDILVRKPLDYAGMCATLKEAGWTKSDVLRAERMARDLDDGLTEFIAEEVRRLTNGRSKNRALNRFINRRHQNQQATKDDAPPE
jgi:hypothetical protein